MEAEYEDSHFLLHYYRLAKVDFLALEYGFWEASGDSIK
jgi:hypothetical protein